MAPAQRTFHESDRRRSVFLVCVLFVCFLFSACGSGDEGVSDPYGLVTDLREDIPPVRSWIQPEVEHRASLANGPQYTLYKPNVLEIGEDGRIYVFDYGDYSVKAFTREGRFVEKYGEGRGRGPGQMMSIADVGVWRDSLVYIVDSRQRRVLYFNRSNGNVVQSEVYEAPITRLAWANQITKYVEAGQRGRREYLIMITPGRRATAPPYLSDDVSSIALDGLLHANQTRAMYVPYYVPVLLTYSLKDTTGLAIPTPDFGTPRSTARDAYGGTFAPSEKMNGASTLSDGILAVRRPGTDSLEFDLYNSEAMEYVHTLRLPIRPGKRHGYADNIVAVARDTTVELYEVRR